MAWGSTVVKHNAGRWRHSGACVFLLSACISRAIPESREEHLSTSPSTLRFDVKAELRSGRLVITYSVQNAGPSAVYLLNRVPDISMQTSPDLIYVERRKDQKLVFAYKNIPAIPPGVSPPMPISPYVTVVRAGAHFEEIVNLATPVREFDAYLPPPITGQVVNYAGVQLEVGYYSEVPGLQESEIQVVPGVKALVTRLPPGKALDFRKLTSPIIPLVVPVLESGP